jgi:Zn-dependent protease with chaperone function/Zn-finger nucleic acid-binding protein
MKCPACGGCDLVETMTRQGVMVDVCEGCRGVWLDRGEIFECSDEPAELQRALDEATLSGESHQRWCPRCHEELLGITFLEDDLWVDLCESCRGMWFDEGELERAVGIDTSTFDLSTDDGAELEVDWGAVDEDGDRRNDWQTPADGGSPAASSGSGSEKQPLADGGSAPGGRTTGVASPSSAVNAPLRTGAGAAAGSTALPNLALRSTGVLAVLYGILVVALIAASEMGYLPPELVLGLAVGTAALQFAISPYMMDLSMNWVYQMHWADRRELPGHLDDFIDRVCRQEGMNYPDIGIIHDGAPNAFTYGHTPDNARIVITEGLLDLLEPEEVEAVVAHEIGHARNWDMLIMTAANLVPIVLYVIYRMLLGADNNNGGKRGAGAGLVAFLLYIISQYIVLFLSRVREYHADRYAGKVTGNPGALASALVRIGYGLASGGDQSRDEDDDGGGFKDNAFGAFGVFDAEAADAMAVASYDADTQSVGATGDGGTVRTSDIDRQRLIGAMRWDLWNPWAKFYELNSTHPLIAERINQLGDQAESQGQQPFIRFDAEQPESYWDEFAVDLLVHVGPMAMFVLAALVGGGTYMANGRIGPLGFMLMLAGLSYIGRTIFSYPSDEFPDHSVASCLKHVKVSGIRGVPVSIDGKLIGKGVPGLIWSEDFVLQDETGIMFLDYRQPLRIWEFLFGLLRNSEYQDRQVRVKGWYRRSPVPYIELKEMHVGGGTETSYVYHVKIAVGMLVALFGGGLIFV